MWPTIIIGTIVFIIIGLALYSTIKSRKDCGSCGGCSNSCCGGDKECCCGEDEADQHDGCCCSDQAKADKGKQ